jgi:hypothetical protein
VPFAGGDRFVYFTRGPDGDDGSAQ